jgi:hypothetical protein
MAELGVGEAQNLLKEHGGYGWLLSLSSRVNPNTLERKQLTEEPGVVVRYSIIINY